MPTTTPPTPSDPKTWASAAWPLGAHHDPAEGSTSFAVAAPDATRVLLETYSAATGSAALTEADLARGDDGVWRGRLAGAGPGTLYGYRCWGPGWTVDPAWRRGGSSAGFTSDIGAGGVRFNPNKVLTDPYAHEITHSPTSPLVVEAGADGGVFGTGGADYRGRPRREHDTGPYAPKAVVVHDTSDTGERPHVADEDTAIYEAHPKGLTRHPSTAHLSTLLHGIPGFEQVVDVPDDLRGTYAGAALMAPYLAALGVTTLELMPVHESAGSEPEPAGPTNYWGYATLGFFAPNRAYAHDRSPGGPTRELKAMVAAFHRHGIEVFLDVVYNHSGEGGQWDGDLCTTGFTCLGGFGTPSYYELTDDARLVDGATGCGNQLDFARPLPRALVVDSVTHWADVMGIDGFRFDLAPVLGRGVDGPDDGPQDDPFSSEHPLLVTLRDLAHDRDIEVIAEPWDLWGYEVGRFPDGWGEWNGRYRDTLRCFLKGDGNTRDFVEVVDGDHRDFADQGGPHRSVNFVTSHDGFTLADLVSFQAHENAQRPPFGPSDGGSDNEHSWDSGGDHTLRRQRIRSFWALLFLSRGVPMVVAGDELGRTQNGNNNPYAVDTIGMWLNWAAAASNAPTAVAVDPGDPSVRYRDVLGTAETAEGTNPLLGFAAYVVRLRRDHPALRQRRYGDPERGGDDVSYLFTSPDGSRPPRDGDRAVRLLIDASAVEGPDLLVLVNMDAQRVDFPVATDPGTAWRRAVDTASTFEPELNSWPLDTGTVIAGDYSVQPWSVVVLARMPSA